MAQSAVANSQAAQDNPRQTEALQRLADAREEKSQIDNTLQNCYFYSAPRRVRAQSSEANQGSANNRPNDDRQLQTSFGFEIADDFASMILETFMPREGPWAERSLPTQLDEDGQENPETEELNALIAVEDAKVHDLIRASNFYAEAAKTGTPDAAIGMMGLLITDPGAGREVQCVGVPIREIDMSLGPDGRPDFRSVTRKMRNRHVVAHLGKTLWEKVPETEKLKMREKPDGHAQISWCWWRNWETFGRHEYTHVVLLGEMLIHETTLEGEGSMAFVVGRFGATPDFAWPDGPMVKALADLVQLDELRGALIENVDFTIRPPKAYEDDGVINIPDDGIQPGDAIPKRNSGGQSAFEDIYEPRPIDSALFEVDMLKTAIRRLHYVDFPEQRGKTPPTATQWIDELVIRQRRIGTPGYAFWHEFPYEVFQRFRYLGEKRGRVQKLADIEGFPGGISLQPYNPAERAQDTQDIQTATQFAQIGQAIAPQMWPVMLDEKQTLDNLKKKFRDKVIVFRNDADVAERLKLLQALASQAMGQIQGGQDGGQQS